MSCIQLIPHAVLWLEEARERHRGSEGTAARSLCLLRSRFSEWSAEQHACMANTIAFEYLLITAHVPGFVCQKAGTQLLLTDSPT